MGITQIIKIFLDDIWVRFKTHSEDESAHHTKYTDAEAQDLIDTHAGLPSVHHDKYTDTEAVAAADASDKFVERNVENLVTAQTILKAVSAPSEIFKLWYQKPSWRVIANPLNLFAESSASYLGTRAWLYFPRVYCKGTDAEHQIGGFRFVKSNAVNESFCEIYVANTIPSPTISVIFRHDSLDLYSNPIKDIKNHADATLSGTPKIIELLIGSTPYYFKVYPTKT